MTDFTSQFLLEARELTEQASQDLLSFEQDPSRTSQLDDAFRAFHTLKGAAAIMEYAPMERLLHQAEDVLQGIRSARTSVTPAAIDGCLACIGQVIRWLDVIEATGALPPDADAAATRVARQFVDGPAPVASAVSSSVSWVADLRSWAKKEHGEKVETARVALRYAPARDSILRGEDPVALVAALPGLVAVRLTPQAPWPALAELQVFESNLIIEALSASPKAEIDALLASHAADVTVVDLAVASPVASPAAASKLIDVARQIILAQKDFVQIPRAADAFAGTIGAAGRVVTNILRALGRSDDAAGVDSAVARSLEDAAPAAFLARLDTLLLAPAPDGAGEPAEARRDAGGAIRVDIDKIDAIVDLTGELLVVKNALAHWMRQAAEGGDPAALATGLRTQHARLERHVSELQRAVLDLRVLPLARVFGRFPLLVRETATRLGKHVAFRSEGDDTQADKAVVEALFEPLLHVVRNAIDHGIEDPEARMRAGKPDTATIVMRSWREGDQVLVEVGDDGRGIDTSAVRRLAVARGLASAGAIDALDDEDVADLIFQPGFTTAASVTDLSGRGVGMNAVRSAVARMGGDVILQNSPGQGLVVRFTLPFTVMMTRVMTVEAGGQMFGIPFDTVVETVRIPRSQIRPLGGGEAVVLRDLTIPVLDLAANLGLTASGKHSAACVVIASVAGQRVGLEIDRPGERLDIMLKPVEGILAGMHAISGTSLMGDGRVLIVLDLGALFG